MALAAAIFIIQVPLLLVPEFPVEQHSPDDYGPLGDHRHALGKRDLRHAGKLSEEAVNNYYGKDQSQQNRRLLSHRAVLRTFAAVPILTKTERADRTANVTIQAHTPANPDSSATYNGRNHHLAAALTHHLVVFHLGHQLVLIAR